jgi:hypothetical protein
MQVKARYSAALFRQLDQNPAGRSGMKEGNPLSLRTQPRGFVDQLNSGGSAFFHSCIDIGYGNTNVMYPGSTLCEIFGDRAVRSRRLQELDERLATLHRGYPGSIRIGQLNLGHPKNVPKKGQDGRERFDRDPDMGYAGLRVAGLVTGTGIGHCSYH